MLRRGPRCSPPWSERPDWRPSPRSSGLASSRPPESACASCAVGCGLEVCAPTPGHCIRPSRGSVRAESAPKPKPKAGARGAVAAWIHLLELRVGTILDDIVQFALARRYRQVRDPCERGTVCVSPLAGAGGRQFAARRPSRGEGRALRCGRASPAVSTARLDIVGLDPSAAQLLVPTRASRQACS